MVTRYFALLTEQNYESFRRLLTDAPPTFKQWQHYRAQIEADILSKRWKLVEVEIDPNEFAADCRATNSPYNLHSLDNFTFKVAQRK